MSRLRLTLCETWGFFKCFFNTGVIVFYLDEVLVAGLDNGADEAHAIEHAGLLGGGARREEELGPELLSCLWTTRIRL